MLKRWWDQRFVSFIKTDNKTSHRFAYSAACSRSDAEKIVQGSRVGDSNAGNIETLRPVFRTTAFKLEKQVLQCSARCSVFPRTAAQSGSSSMSRTSSCKPCAVFPELHTESLVASGADHAPRQREILINFVNLFQRLKNPIFRCPTRYCSCHAQRSRGTTPFCYETECSHGVRHPHTLLQSTALRGIRRGSSWS